MNKRQKLDVKVMRAKMKAEKTLAKHNSAWNAQEVKEVSDGDIRQKV